MSTDTKPLRINIPMTAICSAGTQSRAAINPETVAEYHASYNAGEKLPPLDVFYDGTVYWLADGFHRMLAATAAKMERIWCHVQRGDKRAAILASVAANHTHGMRRTQADKWSAVQLMLSDAEWWELSDHAVADHCHVSHPFVKKVRETMLEAKPACQEAAPETTSTGNVSSCQTEISANQSCENDFVAETPPPVVESDPAGFWDEPVVDETATEAEPMDGSTLPQGRAEPLPAAEPPPAKRRGKDNRLHPASHGSAAQKNKALIKKGLAAWRTLNDVLEKLDLWETNKESMGLLHAALKLEE
jgi:hypothetical protein